MRDGNSRIQRLWGTDAARRPTTGCDEDAGCGGVRHSGCGVRYYTYETTLGYFLEGAAKAGIELIVLDRPDPMTGAFVQGPVSIRERRTSNQLLDGAGAAGMTMGELAKLFNAERNINAKLTVVPMKVGSAETGLIRRGWHG